MKYVIYVDNVQQYLHALQGKSVKRTACVGLIDCNSDDCRGWFPAVILINIINTVQ